MREVAVQAANDTNNDQDRANLQAEMDAMITEIDRIAETTTWAGTNLMKESSSAFDFQVGTATGNANQINISISGMTASDLNLTDSAAGAYSAEGKINVTSVATDAYVASVSQPSVVITEGGADDNAATIKIAPLITDSIDTQPVDVDSNPAHTISLEGVEVTLVGTNADVATINAAWGYLGVTASSTDGTVNGTDYGAGTDTDTPYIDLIFTDVNSPENL
jgi:flagellin